MEVIKKLNLDKFQTEITNKDILPIQIITIALNAGVILFLGVILYLYSTANDQSIASSNDTSTLNILFYIMIIIFPVSIFASRIISKMVLTGKLDSAYQRLDMKESVEKNSLALFNTHHIIKLALLEGSTLFGLIVIFLAAVSGTLRNSDIYWLGLVPLIYMLVTSLINFPTKEKIAEVLRQARDEIQFQ